MRLYPLLIENYNTKEARPLGVPLYISITLNYFAISNLVVSLLPDTLSTNRTV